VKLEKILFGIASAVVGLAGVMPSQVLAHCYAGQVCTPDPCNTHHGGQCPPEVQRSLDAVQTMQKQAASGAAQKVFTVVEIETLKVPIDPSGQTKIVPQVEMPNPGSSSGTISTWPQNSPTKLPAPMTPAAFARQALPVRNAQDLDFLKQGVLDSSRELLDVAASDNTVSKTTATASGRILVQHLNISSEALNQLIQYNKIMGQTSGMIGQGKIPLSKQLWEELEQLTRYTQSIIQREKTSDQ
jgi:hypothetical protein